MKILATTLAAACLAVALPASAASFLFSYAGTGAVLGAFTATGTITTSTTTTTVGGRQAYTITGITGTRNGAAITGLIAAGTDFGGVPIDNYVFASGPYLTSAGFGFSVAGTTNLFNPYYVGDYEEYVRTSTNTNVQNTTNITFTLTPAATAAVPEPASWAMMIGGFGLVGAAARRRSRQVAQAA